MNLKNKQKNNWKNIQIGELLNYEQPTNYIVSSTDYSDNHKIPVLTAGKSFILGYSNETDGIFPKEKLPVIIFDDFTTAHKFVDFPFKVKSSAMKILKNKSKEISDINFIYSWMVIHPFIVGQHKRNYLSEYQYQDVLLPPLSEQKRIVGVLEVWDEGIEKLGRKIEIKENIKKGLLQSMLNCELSIVNGKEIYVPKLRLPGFSGEWEEKMLGDVCEYKNGGSFEKNVVKNGKYLLITLNSINIDGNIKKEHKKVNNADWYLEKDDLVMVLSDIAHGYFLGLVDKIPKNNKYVLNQRMGMIRKKVDFVDIEFIRRFLNLHRTYFKRHGQGSSQQNLSKGDILKFKLRLPDLKEQKAIAEVLTTADEEIEMLRKKLEILKGQKKFLLNNLISGQIRVLK